MTRKTKISCDVTREADNMLKAYCEKHERSKGYLIEKMIRKFCVETPEHEKPGRGIVVQTSIDKTKVPSKRFTPPTSAEVMDYMYEKGVNSSTEPEKFIDFYESKGWVVGKVKMKSWKAAVRNWLKGYKTITTYSNILQDSSDSDWHLKEDKGF